ncbi:MAG: cation diffusion facilitator family transporter, partial [Tenericutes bacterium]|nr:cation diffusion facilitator family transporter [Mycoplasmatota bacterium]
GWMGIKTIFFENYGEIKAPTLIALIAAIISIITKEAMYWYTRSVAKKIKSDALMADAWHHRSDALSSIGSLIGIGGAMMGFKLLDSIASIIICLCIIKVSYDIFMDSVDKMVDKACNSDFINKICDLVLSTNGVLNIDLIKTRLFGNKIYIDLEIAANQDLTLKEAHEIAQKVHDKIENNYEDVKHCMVHVNPKEIN